MTVAMYCLKCRTRTDSREVQPVVMKNGREAVSALCAVCGGKKFRIGQLTAEPATAG